jgi:two-component system chemotaxis response regulator CheB
MAELLNELSHTAILNQEEDPESERLKVEVDVAEMDEHATQEGNHPGRPSVYGCPECGGTLWEIQEGELVYYRCRIGHAYSAQTLLAEQSAALEDALWVALRALQESESLANRMAQRAQERGSTHSAAQFSEQAEAAHERAEIIRRALKSGTLTLGGEMPQPESDQS